MKVKIKSFNGELSEWFTVDKIYDAQSRSEHTFLVEDDEGDLWVCLLNNCPNLNGGSWEVVSE